MSKILEVEQVCDPIKIVVRRDGTISFTALPGKEIEAAGGFNIMPPKEFWDNLGLMLKNMSEAEEKLNTQVSDEVHKVEVQTKIINGFESMLADLRKEKQAEKMVVINGSKKEMFLAGMTFGKNMGRKSSCT